MVTEENVVLVDDHNQVLGHVPRKEMRANKLCHRSAYVFVFNSEGKLFVQERSLSKDIYPGYFDPAAGGVVSEGESYDQAAYRELSEELGIEGVTLQSHFHFYFHSDDCQVWGRVYSCCYDGAITLQKEEVAGVTLELPDDILNNRFNRNYTPCSLVALERLMHAKKRRL